MEQLIREGQWWWPFVVALATAILAYGGSWLGAKLGKSHEHNQWSRNEKIKAYASFLSELNPLSWRTFSIWLGRDDESRASYDDAVQKAYMSLMMLASKDVVVHAIALLNATKEIGKLYDGLPDLVAEALFDSATSGTLTQEQLEAAVIQASSTKTLAQLEKLHELHRTLSNAMRKDLGLPEIDLGMLSFSTLSKQMQERSA